MSSSGSGGLASGSGSGGGKKVNKNGKTLMKVNNSQNFWNSLKCILMWTCLIFFVYMGYLIINFHNTTQKEMWFEGETANHTNALNSDEFKKLFQNLNSTNSQFESSRIELGSKKKCDELMKIYLFNLCIYNKSILEIHGAIVCVGIFLSVVIDRMSLKSKYITVYSLMFIAALLYSIYYITVFIKARNTNLITENEFSDIFGEYWSPFKEEFWIRVTIVLSLLWACIFYWY
jgi:hypothetical protein